MKLCLVVFLALISLILCAQNKNSTEPFSMPDVGDLADRPSSSKTTTCQQEPVCQTWAKNKCKKWKTKMICRTVEKGKKKALPKPSGSASMSPKNPKCRSELRKCHDKRNGKCVRWTCKKDEWEDFMVDDMPKNGFDDDVANDYDDHTYESSPEMSFDDSRESDESEDFGDDEDWDF